MPVSVQGQGGSDAAFAAALVLVKGFDLGQQDGFILLSEWNAGCLPPWSESDLRHKLKGAAASDRQSGYMVKGDDQQRHHTTPDHETEAEKKARFRKSWPEFKRLKPAGVAAIAKLRGIDIDAVDLANRCGLLRGAMFDGHPCFIIREANFAQARRLDGGPLKGKNDEPIKSKNLPGSVGAFVGFSWLTIERHILLVEGCVGLLEGKAALLPHYCALPEAWVVMAATSAYSRFSRDPALLASLAGKHIRIVPDNDQSGTGLNGADTWLADLEAAGATAEIFRIPAPYKDLGEFMAAPETTAEILAQLFQ